MILQGETRFDESVGRVPFESFPAELREQLQSKVDRLGYLGDFFAFAAHQPDALLSFVRFTEALKASMPSNEAALIALCVSASRSNLYELSQHEQLATVQGQGVDWIRAAEAEIAGPPLSATEQRVHCLARAMASGGGPEAEEALGPVVADIGPDRAVGALLLASRYVAHAAVTSALGLRAPVARVLAEPPA